MCGFIGQVSFENIDSRMLEKANNRVVFRGPDNCKIEKLQLDELNLLLIFNRLRILDLSENADQPMYSIDNNSLIMFNGEIFNHLELRKKLESRNVKFKTNNSDTETILNGINTFGKSFINELRGQFSIFYINFRDKKIILCRDRLGQKPLFYKFEEKILTFSSNFKAILESTTNNKLNYDELPSYLSLGVIPSPNSIFKNISKLEPAEVMEISFDDKQFYFHKEKYWELEESYDNKKFSNEEFFQLFSESISLRHIADVPIANFLSGGIDSTSIIKNLHDRGINTNTYSVEFPGSKYDESHWSRLVAKKYQTNHTSIEVNLELDFDNILTSLNSLDEPYSDPSVIPSNLIAKEISRNFKVALSGDGGDELLGGYTRVNQSLKNNIFQSNIFSKLYFLYPSMLGSGNILLSRSDNLEIRYKSYLEDIKFLNLLKINTYDNAFKINKNLDSYKSIISAEYKLFLSEMMLLKIDRTSMFNSLEVRSPFLDHKLIEYVFSHDISYVNLNQPKSILKDYLLEDFNIDFLNRPKQGFVFDLDDWIKKNEKNIKEYLYCSNLKNIMELKNLNYLFKIKSKQNGIRIWKLIVLSHFLHNS